MHLVKNILVICVVLIAISATIASHAGAFSNTKLAPPAPGCYETVNGFTIDHSWDCGDIVDFCAETATTPSYCEGADHACCFVVTSMLCNNEQERVVTEIRCGEFIPVESFN